MLQSSVQSSNILKVFWENETLFITFHGRSDGPRTYRYAATPVSVYNDLIAAPSVGSHFSKHVKNNFTAEPTQLML